MRSIIYKIYLFAWSINPFKKLSLSLLKKTKFVKNPKVTNDLYFNGKFLTKFEELSFYLFTKKYEKGSFDIYLKGLEKGWDRFSLKIWKGLAEKSSCVIDVGTNIGLYCLVAKATNVNAMVVGFEPSNNSYDTVKKNIEINKLDILLEKIALSDANGKATFYDLKQPTAVSSLVLNPNLKSEDLISYEVKTKTFDDYVIENKINKVDLISIDVEEHEEQVLLGMKRTLEKDRPSILIEVLRDDLGEKIQNVLDVYNYTYYFINENGFLKPTTHLNQRPKDFLNSYNVLAVFKDELQEMIQSEYNVV